MSFCKEIECVFFNKVYICLHAFYSHTGSHLRLDIYQTQVNIGSHHESAK